MWTMILLRMWRERRLMVALLLSITLVTGFLALGPLYVQTIAAAEFEVRATNAPDRAFRLDLRSDVPLETETVAPLLDDALGDRIAWARAFSTSQQWLFGVREREVNGEIQRFDGSQYRPYAFSDFDDLFELSEGRLPAADPPEGVDVEAVITRGMIELDRLRLGDRVSLSTSEGEPVTVAIVGIVSPLLPETDTFWEGMTVFEIINTPVGQNNLRPDLTFIVRPAAFQSYLLPAIAPDGRLYQWRAGLDRDRINAADVGAVSVDLTAARERLQVAYPTVSFSTPLDHLISAFENGVQQASGPVLFLSLLVMALMLTNLVTITALVLERQREEWAMIASRGGSTGQLVRVQAVTVTLLALVGALLGPLLAYLLMVFLTLVGPQAAILESTHISRIELESLGLSGAAALVIVLVLTFPAWTAARTSHLHIRESISRPPTRPAWARVYLDVIFLGLGLAFMLRLYALATDSGLAGLLEDPSAVLRVLFL